MQGDFVDFLNSLWLGRVMLERFDRGEVYTGWSPSPSRVPATGTPEARGHVWELDNDGDIVSEEFADDGWKACGGPRCTVCGYVYCQFCHDAPPAICRAALSAVATLTPS